MIARYLISIYGISLTVRVPPSHTSGVVLGERLSASQSISFGVTFDCLSSS